MPRGGDRIRSGHGESFKDIGAIGHAKPSRSNSLVPCKPKNTDNARRSEKPPRRNTIHPLKPGKMSV